MENNISIEGVEYAFVKQRVQAPIDIYTGKKGFLRIGPKEILQKEVLFQKHLLELGFPVPNIIATGEHNDRYYFIEESFGKDVVAIAFSKDMKEVGYIRDNNFLSFLDISKKYTNAQLHTNEECINQERFSSEQLHLTTIISELPILEAKTKEAVSKAMNTIQEFPTVLSHGDFCPWNIFEKGVIDLEHFSYAPVGYDLVANIYQTYMFPNAQDFETYRMYAFTNEQIDHYFKEMDALFTEHNIPLLSEVIDTFIFLRFIWATVRMAKQPKIQTWRYILYEDLLNRYLANKDIAEYIIQYVTI